MKESQGSQNLSDPLKFHNQNYQYLFIFNSVFHCYNTLKIKIAITDFNKFYKYALYNSLLFGTYFQVSFIFPIFVYREAK